MLISGNAILANALEYELTTAALSNSPLFIVEEINKKLHHLFLVKFKTNLMNKKEVKINWLIEQIDTILDSAFQMGQKYVATLLKVHPLFEKSARNLIYYRTLRSMDIRDLQKKMGNMGLSRLAKAESHIIASLIANKNILQHLLHVESAKTEKAELSFKKSRRLEKYNVKKLLGYRSENRPSRIMVTIPFEAANNYQLIYDMIQSGMNCARINCAHDDAIVWKQMIDHIRTASTELKRKCKIAMDLGGPKIRTGSLAPGPKIKKFRPTKNIRGQVVKPSTIWIGENPHENKSYFHLPVKWDNKIKLVVGHQLFFRDTRNKKRKFIIIETSEKGCVVQCHKTTFLETGMKLFIDKKRSTTSIEVSELPHIQLPIILHKGDILRLHKENSPGNNAVKDDKGNTITPAHISCTLPQIIKEVKVGEPVFFDDGKIEGVFREVNEEEALIEILNAQEKGAKLRADKGINLPSSNLSISGLTEKDKKDLEFVIKHADVINLSFVNSAQDVRDLLIELNRLKASKNLGIILKIETQSGFNNLTKILLEGMQVHPLGVMIARGDLAVECGWENIARVQEEILALCQAAHVPVVWATQVLENLSKKGTPSRAEITDAAMAMRAGAVMLNKGPFILQSIQLLDSILSDLAPYHEKNLPLLPKMEKANIKHQKL